MAGGCVYLVGVGPGEPSLITVKGKQILEQADVVVYDYLIQPQILSWTKETCEKISVGKRKDKESPSQEEVVQLLEEKVREGKKVARLKDGDPFLFGRGAEELVALKAKGVPFEVVSGLTSALTVPAYAGIPLSYHGLSPSVGLFIISQKSLHSMQWDKIAGCVRTLVFLRGVDVLQLIVEKLIENGLPVSTPAAMLQWGTLQKQVVVTGILADIVSKTADVDKEAPSIIVVGEVVKLRESLAWFTPKPLSGLKILVTRAAEQAGELSALLLEAGGWPIELPTIKIQPLAEPEVLKAALQNLSQFDWLIFSSTNTVSYFKEALAVWGKDVRELKGIKIICVGTSTAKKVAEWGLRVDLIPQEFNAEGIIAELKKMNIEGQRFLFPRAKEGREILPQAIQEMKGEVVLAPIYETVAAKESASSIKQLLIDKELDVITFTSSSTVEHFQELIDNNLEWLTKVKIAVIGPVTLKTAEKLGLKIDIMPATSTMEGLVGALIDYYKK